MKLLHTFLLSLTALSACATTPADTHHAASHATSHSEEGRVYHEDRDARADIDAALALAQASGRRALLVFGANWCHDSRGFAEHLERPAIKAFVDENFEVAFIDIGVRERNLDLAAQYGQSRIFGTPTLVVVEADGTRINSEDDATAWRNADSRTPEQVLTDLRVYLP